MKKARIPYAGLRRNPGHGSSVLANELSDDDGTRVVLGTIEVTAGGEHDLTRSVPTRRELVYPSLVFVDRPRLGQGYPVPLGSRLGRHDDQVVPVHLPRT